MVQAHTLPKEVSLTGGRLNFPKFPGKGIPNF